MKSLFIHLYKKKIPKNRNSSLQNTNFKRLSKNNYKENILLYEILCLNFNYIKIYKENICFSKFHLWKISPNFKF